jgi:calcineurin-like phosphoesterase family protein
MTNVWFTADTHFDHEAIITSCHRPFKSTEEMNEVLIENWNKVVKRGDLVYHLGDFAITDSHQRVEELLARLNGSVHWIWGNHDHSRNRRAEGFAWKGYYQRARVRAPWQDSRMSMILFHYALRTWDGMYGTDGTDGTWQLHGHSHGGLDPRAGQIDVGVDAWGYTPAALEDIRQAMQER